MSTHVIVTRYREHIDWIRYIIDKIDTVYIYNKGPNNDFFTHFDPSLYTAKIKIINCIIKKLLYLFLTQTIYKL